MTPQTLTPRDLQEHLREGSQSSDNHGIFRYIPRNKQEGGESSPQGAAGTVRPGPNTLALPGILP